MSSWLGRGARGEKPAGALLTRQRTTLAPRPSTPQPSPRPTARSITVGGPEIPVGPIAVIATSSGSSVPNAPAVRLPLPAAWRLVTQRPFVPRACTSHQRTVTLSPGATVNCVGPSPLTGVTRGAAGSVPPNHGDAGTRARSAYAPLASAPPSAT